MFFRRLPLSVLCFVLVGSTALAAAPEKEPSTLATRAKALWPSTVSPYLQQPLWRPASAYNATHFMMIPLQAAFTGSDKAPRADFAAHFKALNEHFDELTTSDALSRLQYLYLASRFIALANAAHANDQIPPDLPGKVLTDVLHYWTQVPAWQWERSPFPGGIRERVRWKLDNKDAGKSYLHAILDEEIYVFTIAADLYTARDAFPQVKAQEPALRDVLAIAAEVFDHRAVRTQDGGWLFQPGAWRDHPDFAFAGASAKAKSLKATPVSTVAEDTSHSHRMPAWLLSLDAAESQRGSSDPKRYQRLIQGLRQQFLTHVLVAPTPDFPGYRTTNYMDGSNGLYRWGYASFGQDRGYGPYENSGTLMMGWWSLLGGSQLAATYASIAASFPLPKPVLALYSGPPGKNQPEDAYTPATWLTNGLAEVIADLASGVALSRAP